MTVAVVVVTFDRQALLKRCLTALTAQNAVIDHVIVIDNASTDGTRGWLERWLPTNLPNAAARTLAANEGGAAGFAAGLRDAVAAGADWVWMMDDDAEPHPMALCELLAVATDPENIYGSLAVCGEHTSWPLTLLDDGRVIYNASDMPVQAQVAYLPMLGLLIHHRLVRRIGYPDAGFFIAADDVEYCVRARRAGAKIFVAGRSRIEHPRARRLVIELFGAQIFYVSLAPWKRYYDTRNRLLIARKYFGIKLLTQTIPGSFVRLFAALVHEPRKPAQFWAWCCGMVDGLLGIKGKRHGKWGIWK